MDNRTICHLNFSSENHHRRLNRTQCIKAFCLFYFIPFKSLSKPSLKKILNLHDELVVDKFMNVIGNLKFIQSVTLLSVILLVPILKEVSEFFFTFSLQHNPGNGPPTAAFYAYIWQAIEFYFYIGLVLLTILRLILIFIINYGHLQLYLYDDNNKNTRERLLRKQDGQEAIPSSKVLETANGGEAVLLIDVNELNLHENCLPSSPPPIIIRTEERAMENSRDKLRFPLPKNYDDTSVLSRITFHWVGHLIDRVQVFGAVTTLRAESLVQTSRKLRYKYLYRRYLTRYISSSISSSAPSDTSNELAPAVNHLPENFCRDDWHHRHDDGKREIIDVFRLLRETTGFKFLALGLLKLANDLINFGCPLLLNVLLVALQNQQSPTSATGNRTKVVLTSNVTTTFNSSSHLSATEPEYAADSYIKSIIGSGMGLALATICCTVLMTHFDFQIRLLTIRVKSILLNLLYETVTRTPLSKLTSAVDSLSIPEDRVQNHKSEPAAIPINEASVCADRAACSSPEAVNKNSSPSLEGTLLTVISSDVDRVVNFFGTFHSFWSLPLQIIVSLYLLYRQIGLNFLAGIALAVAMIPINKYLATRIVRYNSRMMVAKDSRLRYVTQMLTNWHAVKVLNLDAFFERKIRAARQIELRYVGYQKYLDALCVYFWATTPVLMSVSTFVSFILYQVYTYRHWAANPNLDPSGNASARDVPSLDSSKIFTSLALFNMLIAPLNSFPWVVNGLIEAWISFGRIQKLFNVLGCRGGEEDTSSHHQDHQQPLTTPIEKQSSIIKHRPFASIAKTHHAQTLENSATVTPLRARATNLLVQFLNFNEGLFVCDGATTINSTPLINTVDETTVDITRNPKFQFKRYLMLSDCRMSWKQLTRPHGSYPGTQNGIAFSLTNLNVRLVLNEPRLIGLSGPIGSGKSSFLLGLMNELTISTSSSGSAYNLSHLMCFNVLRKKRGGQSQIIPQDEMVILPIQLLLSQIPISYGTLAISYSGQKPWIQRGTIRSNIIFGGSPFDPTKYEKIVNAVKLNEDFETMPYGDLTQVGDGAGSLSGGQQTRVCIARAMYRADQSDLILLDEPLASLDNKVARYVFKHAIQGYLVHELGKVVLFATHLTRFFGECDELWRFVPVPVPVIDDHSKDVSDSAAYTIEMDIHDGDDREGSKPIKTPDMQATSPLTPIKQSPNTTNLRENVPISKPHTKDEDIIDRIESCDDRGDGTISKTVVSYYVKSVGIGLFALIFLSFLAMQITRNGCDWWLTTYKTLGTSTKINETFGNFARFNLTSPTPDKYPLQSHASSFKERRHTTSNGTAPIGFQLLTIKDFDSLVEYKPSMNSIFSILISPPLFPRLSSYSYAQEPVVPHFFQNQQQQQQAPTKAYRAKRDGASAAASDWVEVDIMTQTLRQFLFVYLSLGLLNSIFTLARAFLFARGGLVAARRCHDYLFKATLSADPELFNNAAAHAQPTANTSLTTGKGKGTNQSNHRNYSSDQSSLSGLLINRFSADTYTIDNSLPFSANILLALIFGLAGTLIIGCWAQPWLLPLAFPVAALCYCDLQGYYRKASREIRRLEASLLAPVLSKFAECLEGKVYIRNFSSNAEERGWKDDSEDEEASGLNPTTRVKEDPDLLLDQNEEELSVKFHNVSKLTEMPHPNFTPSPSDITSTAFKDPVSNVLTQFTGDFAQIVDNYLRATFNSSALGQWLNLRLQIFGTLLICSLIFLITLQCIYLPTSSNSASTGLALSYFLILTGLLGALVMVLVDTEKEFISVERIKEFADSLTPETDDCGYKLEESANNPPTEEGGEIIFENVTVSYHGKDKHSQDLFLALKNVSFTIPPGQRVGIVGRTGAGKSTLFSTLLKMTKPCPTTTTTTPKSRISVSGYDFDHLNPNYLRAELVTVVPQTPFILPATLRTNLDPKGRFTDAEIWELLEQSNLKATILGQIGSMNTLVTSDSLDEAEEGSTENGKRGSSRFQSDTIKPNRIDLSHGQKQILSLARAVVNKSKIMIIDEPTSNLDKPTQDFITECIFSTPAFTECTILIIAHRLDTLKYCDRIIVMEKGRLVEDGKPQTLLNDPSSKLYSYAHFH